MDGIRGLTDACFEIDKRDYLAHPAVVGLRRNPQPNRSKYPGTSGKFGARLSSRGARRGHILQFTLVTAGRSGDSATCAGLIRVVRSWPKNRRK